MQVFFLALSIAVVAGDADFSYGAPQAAPSFPGLAPSYGAPAAPSYGAPPAPAPCYPKTETQIQYQTQVKEVRLEG